MFYHTNIYFENWLQIPNIAFYLKNQLPNLKFIL